MECSFSNASSGARCPCLRDTAVRRPPGGLQKKANKGGWDGERRVVAKAEHIDGKENPRFVVTSLTSQEWAAQALYEQLYSARGDMENRIKEQFSLFAGRVSAETMRANQMRLYLSTMAYVLVSGLRRLGLKGTELAEAQVSTIRTKLLRIGAQIGVATIGDYSQGIGAVATHTFRTADDSSGTAIRCILTTPSRDLE